MSYSRRTITVTKQARPANITITSKTDNYRFHFDMKMFLFRHGNGIFATRVQIPDRWIIDGQTLRGPHKSYRNLMTIRQFRQRIIDSLTPLYGIEEARSVASLLAEHLEGVGTTDIIARPDTECRTSEEEFNTILSRLVSGEPVRHITGHTTFLERDFSVTSDTLIPRPETEELVFRIIKEYKGTTPPPRVIDIATGSGVIAISLALELGSDTLAIDISAPALEVARRNAAALGCDNIRFEKLDILSAERLPQADIIVSNPPYVRECEKAEMSHSVLDYEPHIALFVPDSDPLLFYRKIASLAFDALSSGGALFFEINEALPEQTAEVCREAGFRQVETASDLFGKKRFVKALKP